MSEAAELLSRAKAIRNSPRDIKADLLAHYARKEPHSYLQLDVFVSEPGGGCAGLGNVDEDGDCLNVGHTLELRSGMVPIRVHVLDGTSKADTIRTLRKLTDWLERESELDWRDLVGLSNKRAADA